MSGKFAKSIELICSIYSEKPSTFMAPCIVTDFLQMLKQIHVVVAVGKLKTVVN